MATQNSTGNFFSSLSKNRGTHRTGATFLGLILGVLLWVSGCTTSPREKTNPLAGPQAADHVSIMAYNVENLFDELHDAGKDDYPYLPRKEKKSKEVQDYCKTQSGFRAAECFDLNWDNNAVMKKLKSVADGLLQVHEKGPDVLILEEVENLRILKRLNDEVLKQLGVDYPTIVLIEGEDKRGIDVGFMSKFPLAGTPKLHQIEFTPSEDGSEHWPTRGILEVPVQLPGGATLTVYGVHLPSQANPVQDRIDAINMLIKLVGEKKPDDLWVIGGDWNVSAREDDETGLISKKMNEVGLVSHIVGCQDCRGTHNYHGVWSFFDILVFSKSFGETGSAPYKLIPSSIWTPRASRLQLQNNGRPQRFDLKENTGISDHLPIYAEIQKR